MDAVRRRNWATMVQLPAATSWSSAMQSETKAKTTAATNELTATEYSKVLLPLNLMFVYVRVHGAKSLAATWTSSSCSTGHDKLP